MQNMETFFGFKVYVNNDLDPEDEKILRARANEIVQNSEIDLSDYLVYLHQLVIRANDVHFGCGGGLSRRVRKINIEFHINKKQRGNNDIRFMNHIIDTGVAKTVKPYFRPEWIGYDIPVAFFDDQSWFQNAIIAFVRKEMRHSHKKIKAIVTASATTEFANILHSRKMVDVATELDLKFEREVQLRLPMDRFDLSPSSGVVNMTFNNYGNAGAFGTNAKASDFTQNQQLAVDLKQLAIEAKKHNKEDEAGDIEALLESIKNKKNMKALDYLKRLGGWALETSKTLGLVAAEEAIKAAVGG